MSIKYDYYDDEDEIELTSPINSESSDNISNNTSKNKENQPLVELGSNANNLFKSLPEHTNVTVSKVIDPKTNNIISITVSKVIDPKTNKIISEKKVNKKDKSKPKIKGKPKCYKFEFKEGADLDDIQEIDEHNGDLIFSTIEIDAELTELDSLKNEKQKKIISFKNKEREEYYKDMKKFIKKELNLLKDRKKELSINLKEVRKDLNKKK